MSLPALTIRVGKAEVVLVPVVHYHPGAAWVAVHVLDSVRPDVVAIELPEGLEHDVIDALPDESSIASALVYRPSVSPSAGRQVIVLSVADAFTLAALWAVAKNVPLACVDLPCSDDLPNECEDDFPDPWAARSLGQRYAEMALDSLAEVRSERHERRNRQMAANLQQLALRHRRIVAIVGAAHALPVEGLLRAGRFAIREQIAADGGSTRADVDAGLLVRHYLGPLPAIALALNKAFRRQQTGAFDPRAEVERIVEHAATDYARDVQAIDVTQRIHFWSTLWCWVTNRRRTVPTLGELYQAARASVNDNDEFARYVAYHGIGLFLKPRHDSNRAVVVEADNDTVSVDVDGRRIAVRPRSMRGPAVPMPLLVDVLENWRDARRCRETEEHTVSDLGMLSDTKTWDGQIAIWDRAMAMNNDQQSIAMPWRGGALRYVDCRAMVRQICKGRRTLVVRRPTMAAMRMDDQSSDPVVVLFDDDLRARPVNAFCLGVYSDRSCYYHTSANLASEIRYTDNKTVYRLAARAAFVSPHLVNFDIALRHKNQSAARRWFSRWLASDNNEAHIPKREVFSDLSLLNQLPVNLRAIAKACPPWEWMTMAAILYARKQVIFVARQPPSLWLHNLARQRRIRLQTLPLSYFPEYEREAASTYALRLTPRIW